MAPQEEKGNGSRGQTQLVPQHLWADEDELWSASVPLAGPPQDEAESCPEIRLPKDGRGQRHRLCVVVGRMVVLAQAEGLVPMARTAQGLPHLRGRRFREK